MQYVETDLILMSLLIFLPTAFALVLAFFPRGSDEWMKWWALLGTAATLVVSLCLFIDFRAMQDHFLNVKEKMSLDQRAMENLKARESGDKQTPTSGYNDMVGRMDWIRQLNIQYYLGIDGISMAMILLTTAITFLSMIASWSIEKHVRGYCMLFLLLETGVLGTFMALDLFLFFVFWEVMLLPMYFLIGVWGGPRREYAAVKFFLYTMLGSVFILIAILGCYFTDVRDHVDPKVLAYKTAELKQKNPKLTEAEALRQVSVHTFDLMVLQRAGQAAMQHLNGQQPDSPGQKAAGDDVAKLGAVQQRLEQPFFSGAWQLAFFIMLFVGFAIKVPIFPFHTWLPDAHVEAPTPISMILAGILLKLGGYGIIRIAYPLCPWAAESLAWWVALLGIINIVYGAFAAMAQTDFKKLVAYSSVSHMGYVILGIAVWSSAPQFWSWGMNGAMYQMIAHGVSSAGMFFMVGVIYERAHHRNLNNFRGLYEPMPLYGGLSAIIFFAALGLPGLCGFVGEFAVVLATWNYDKTFAILAALTVVITAAYVLWTLQRVYLGVNPAYKDYADINFRELLCAIPLVVLAVLLGVYPGLIFNWMEPSVTGLVESLAQLPRSITR